MDCEKDDMNKEGVNMEMKADSGRVEENTC